MVWPARTCRVASPRKECAASCPALSLATARVNRRRWRCSMIPHPPRPHRVAPGVAFVVALAAPGSVTTPAQCDEPESIVWRDDYGSALEEARAANRLLWIQFTGPWCPNCTRMERDSFPHAGDHPARATIVRALEAPFRRPRATGPRASISPGSPPPSSSPRTARSSRSIRGISARPSSTPFCAIAWRGVPEQPADTSSARRPYRFARPDAAKRCRAEERNAARPLRLLRGQLDLRPQAGSGPGRLHSPPRGTDLSFRQSSDERSLPKGARALPPRQRWRLPGHRRWTRGIAQPGDPRWGVLYRGHLFLCATQEDRRAVPQEPRASTPWSTSPKRASACTACATRGSWSAATRATRSRARAGDTGFPTPIIVTPSWTHCAKKRARITCRNRRSKDQVMPRVPDPATG